MKNHENHDQHEGQESARKGHGGEHSGPYWKRAHHDWRFWAAAILGLLAITIYVLSADLSMKPVNSNQVAPPVQARVK